MTDHVQDINKPPATLPKKGGAVEDTSGSKKEFPPYPVVHATDERGHILKLSDRPSGMFPQYANDRTCAAIEIRTGPTGKGTFMTNFKLRTPGYNPKGSQYSRNNLDTNGQFSAFVKNKGVTGFINNNDSQRIIGEAFKLIDTSDGFVSTIPITIGMRDSIAALPDEACAKEVGDAYTKGS